MTDICRLWSGYKWMGENQIYLAKKGKQTHELKRKNKNIARHTGIKLLHSTHAKEKCNQCNFLNYIKFKSNSHFLNGDSKSKC